VQAALATGRGLGVDAVVARLSFASFTLRHGAPLTVGVAVFGYCFKSTKLLNVVPIFRLYSFNTVITVSTAN
jgi:hypothetical protein